MLCSNKISYFAYFYVVCFYVYMCLLGKILVVSQEISQTIENSFKLVSNNTSTNDKEFAIDKNWLKETENKFFIKLNTIIRTGESRTLGAKYLNETRMPSNHDCLTWCLETSACNAAVYEEKNMQSCYLFDCGSPAKPLCKFTPHNFFISSILKISQHSYELSQWGKQVQQERIKTEHHNDVVVTSPAPLNTYTLPSTSAVPTNLEHVEKKGTVCHHYQFQCVNNSECIAIYNVCDGIPQCPDGSDESSELKCPSKGGGPKEISANIKRPSASPPTLEIKTPTVKEKLSAAKPPVPFTSNQNIQPYPKSPKLKELQHKEDYTERENWPKAYPDSRMAKTGYHKQIDDSDGLGSPFIHKHSQFMAANDPHVQNLNRWVNDYDPYPPHPTSLEQQYNPYERMDDQFLPNPPMEYDSGKGFNGYHPDDIPYWPNQDIMQDTSYTIDEFPQPGVQNMNKAMIYPDKENRESYVQQISRTADQFPEPKMSMHTPVLSQQLDIDDYKLHRYPHGRQQASYLGVEDGPHQHFSGYPNLKDKQLNPIQNMDDTLYSNDDLIRASIVNQLPKKIDQVHQIREHNINRSNKNTLPQSRRNEPAIESTASSKDNKEINTKPTEPSSNIQKTVLDFKMSVAELYQSTNTHTHESNSAILALVVGVIISFLLIILLACRIRVLRRRMSRKGRSLAHDADYLVNGMYL